MNNFYSAIFVKLFLILSSISIASMDDFDHNGLKKISEGVYAGKGTTTGGEQIYFGMELLTLESSKYWNQYKMRTDAIISYNSFMYCALRKNLRAHPNTEILKAEDTGFTNLELENFLSIIEEAKKKRPTIATLIDEIGSATSAFNTDVDPDSYDGPQPDKYVAYVSKKPVTGRYPFKDMPKIGGRLKQYIEAYDDLLMCVGVINRPGRTYENRGIFRNPISFLHASYKGISLKLHDFTAVVMATELNKKLLIVRPIFEMHLILCKNHSRDNMFVNSTSDESKKFLKLPKEFFNDNLTENDIDQWFAHQKSELEIQKKTLSVTGNLQNQNNDYFGETIHLIRISSMVARFKK